MPVLLSEMPQDAGNAQGEYPDMAAACCRLNRRKAARSRQSGRLCHILKFSIFFAKKQVHYVPIFL